MPLLDVGSFALTTQALQDLGLKGSLALVPSWQVGLEHSAPADLDRLDAEGFRTNEVVYACVREIATTAAEVQLRAVDDAGAPQPAHPLQRLLTRPYPELSGFELIEAVLTDLLVFGNAFLLKERAPQLTQTPTRAHEPVPHGSLGRSLASSLFTFNGMTRLVDRIENMSFVTREPVPGDRRGVAVGLTPAGAEKYEQAIARHRTDVEREFGSRLTPDQHRAIADALAPFWRDDLEPDGG